MKLNQLAGKHGATKSRRRVGRGPGSGTGKTSGHGQKGQKSRSGVALGSFEGGQMPIHMRLPKRGFNNISAKQFQVVNIGRLQQAVDAGKLDPKQPVDGAALKAAGVIRRERDGVRMLAKGELKSKLTLNVTGASDAARAAIEKAGGSITVAVAKAKKEGKKARRKAEAIDKVRGRLEQKSKEPSVAEASPPPEG